ncbi:MAG: PAS domain-containing protein [Anaerolineae bacterium]|nr:PAS domain-containing protein [Anaerolineae bacterium]
MAALAKRRLNTSLIDPYIHIPNAERRHNARVLAGILLVMFPALLIGLLIIAILDPAASEILERALPYTALLLASTIATYFMARLGRERLAAASMLAIVNLIILLSLDPGGIFYSDTTFLYFLIPIVLICAFISIIGGLISLLLITLISLLYTSQVIAPVINPEPCYHAIVKMSIIGLVVIATMIHVKYVTAVTRKRLQHNEMILRLIQENVSDMVTITDRAFNVDFQSDSVRQLSGAQATEIDDAFWRTSIEPEDQPDVARAVDLALHTRTSSRAEYRHKAADGQIHWYETTFNLVRDMNGMERLITISRNIDERKAAELTLAKERAQLRTVVDTLPDHIYIKDMDGRYLLYNQCYLAFLQVFRGAKDGEIIGKTVRDMYSPKMARALSEQDEKVFSSKQAFVNNQFRYEEGGEFRYFAITKNPMFDADGEMIGLIGCSRDITQQVKLEGQQREHERLQMALDKERDLNELKNLFMVTISHEFRTPLATILSSSELLLSYAARMTEERRVECLRTIAGEVKRLTLMLDDIRTVMQMQRHEARLNIEPIALPDFLEGIFSGLEYAADRVCDIRISPETALIHGDRLLLRHIAHNVLCNAARYSPPGSTIVVRGTRADDGRMALEISDRGSGISEAEIAHVFDPFFRGSKTQTSGTGLGLTIVKHCLDLYGGAVELESDVGKGTRVSITLPLYAAAEADPINYANAQSTGE